MINYQWKNGNGTNNYYYLQVAYRYIKPCYNLNSSRPFLTNPGRASSSRDRAASISTSPQILKHSLVVVELWLGDSGWPRKSVSRAESSYTLICSVLRRKIVMVTRSTADERWGIREIMETTIQAQERGDSESVCRIILSKEILWRQMFWDRSSCLLRVTVKELLNNLELESTE